MWDSAAKAGLILGAISTAYMFISQFLGNVQMNAFIMSVLSLLLWAAKFGGGIWALAFLMKRFSIQNPETSNSSTFRFGMVASLLSSLIFAAANFANIGYISADYYQAQMEQIMQILSAQMDANTLTLMQETIQNLPQMMFWYTLIYCIIFGTILSYILSRNIPSRNPFADYKPEEQ